MYFYARKQNQNDDSFLYLQFLYLSYAIEQNSSILKQIVQMDPEQHGQVLAWKSFQYPST